LKVCLLGAFALTKEDTIVTSNDKLFDGGVELLLLQE